MDLDTEVKLSASLDLDGCCITVEVARVRGRKFVVEIGGLDADVISHYWFDTFEEAKKDFLEIIKENISEVAVEPF